MRLAAEKSLRSESKLPTPTVREVTLQKVLDHSAPVDGRHRAELRAATMSQRFTFDLAPGIPVELEATLTLRPKNGLHVIAQRRETL